MGRDTEVRTRDRQGFFHTGAHARRRVGAIMTGCDVFHPHGEAVAGGKRPKSRGEGAAQGGETGATDNSATGTLVIAARNRREVDVKRRDDAKAKHGGC